MTKKDIQERIADLNERTNSLMYKLGFASIAVKQKLFLTQCLHAYGSETWNLGGTDASMFWRATGQAARRLVELPPSCRTSIVDTIYKARIAKTMVFKKCLSMINAFRESKNVKVNFMYHVAMADSRSIIRRNLDCIHKEWGGYNPPALIADTSPECVGIQELIGIRHSSYTMDVDTDDVDRWIMLLCMR